MTSVQADRRILIKLSGEALGGQEGRGIDPAVLAAMAGAILKIKAAGVQVALVIGGGNVFRGAALQKAGLDRTVGDQMGMLATVMNGLAMRDELIRQGGKCMLYSAHGIPSITAQYAIAEARAKLDEGFVVIVSGGTGNPFFTTDTAAILRGIELSCTEVLKGTKVDGVYSADPFKDPDAVRYSTLGFDEVIAKKLEVMDLTAFALAREQHMPIRVFSMNKPGALLRAATGEDEGTLVS